ncbi:MAG: hypothetical protein ACI92G_002886 [Candidatus Pelagisphaera sp.]|jgi:hypothetical protein
MENAPRIGSNLDKFDAFQRMEKGIEVMNFRGVWNESYPMRKISWKQIRDSKWSKKEVGFRVVF